MKNKKYIILAGVVLILAIAAGAIIYFTKNKPGENKTEDVKLASDVEELQKIYSQNKDDSLAFIDKALADKKINYETSLVYKAYAIFGDGQLPAEYKSNAVIFNSNVVLYEIQTKFKSLSKETQEKLAPFLKRPEDPGSYINLQYAKTKTTKDNDLFIKAANAQRVDANLYTDFLISADNRVKIWYPNDTVSALASVWEDGDGAVITSTAVSRAMADSIKNHLDNDKIMQRYIDLLGKEIKKDGTRGGDDKLDIYVAPAGTNLGVSYGESGTPCSSYIFINISIGDKRDTILKTVLAHEIFHSYQYAYKYDVVKDNWWGEATAVWSEDFIYSDANTEQPRLSGFFHYPETELFKETPPSAHHYSAYIFPFFITKKYGNEFMKKSWNGCDGKDCLKSMDEIIEGGFKQQWKEFTLWNYNREPAKFYTDQNGFSKTAMADSKSKEDYFIAAKQQDISVPEVKPLSARLDDALLAMEDKDVKLVTFKDLRNFTGQAKTANIKAVIYYKNGKKEVEDWTDKKERSFCIENEEEEFEKISLIFSNADMKKKTSKTKINIEGKPTCYRISQEDKTTAVIHFPYANEGGMQKVNIDTTVEVNSSGDAIAKAAEGQKYAYLTKWKLNYEFEQIRKAFTVNCGDSTAVFDAGWTSRSAGFLEFDLKLKDPNATEGTFSIDMTYGLPHPHGNYEDVPAVKANCISAYVNAMKMNTSGIKGTVKNVYQGRIYDITDDGAKIEIPNSCLYSGCTMTTGEPFQTMDKIILEIKK